MRRVAISVLLSSSLLFCKNTLQDAIDRAKSGSLLELPAGEYRGNIVIDKPLIIDGKDGRAKIIGSGDGTVIKIRSPFVTIKNLTILNSGSEHENIDAGISIKKVSNVEVENCHIEDCLFGIDLEQVDSSKISHNYIKSKDFSLGLRGDGIRLWYSNDNNITHNHLDHSRDMVVWYSHGNRISDNFGEYGRYSLHFMYAGKNYVHNNRYEHNSVGIFFMYSQDSIAVGNVVSNSLGTTGLGIGLKDCSNFKIEKNVIIYCARGIYIDRSPFQARTRETSSRDNRILYKS